MNYSNIIWRTIIWRTITMLLLFSGLTGLNGCGNKGPLYIPEPPVQQQPAAPAEKSSEEK